MFLKLEKNNRQNFRKAYFYYVVGNQLTEKPSTETDKVQTLFLNLFYLDYSKNKLLIWRPVTKWSWKSKVFWMNGENLKNANLDHIL